MNLKVNTSFISNDNYSPELNPLNSILRSIISPAWRGYRGLGFPSETEQADIFRSTFFYIIDIFSNPSKIGNLYNILMMIVGGYFLGMISSLTILKLKLINYSKLAFLTSSITYLCTLWIIWINYQTIAPYTNAFGITPLLIYSLYRYIESKKNKDLIWVFIASLLFNATSVISTLALTNLLFVFLFVLILRLDSLTKDLKAVLIGFGIVLGSQLFWILPFVLYIINSSQGLVDSMINRSITASVVDLERLNQTASNAFNFYTRILTDTKNNELVFSGGKEYLSTEILRVISYIPILLSLISAVIALFTKRFKFFLIALLGIALWLFIKVDNPPFGGLFTFFQEHIPLFAQVLRWPVSKIGGVYLIVVAFLSGIGIVFLKELLDSLLFSKIKVVSTVLLTLLFVAPQLYFAQFLFNGTLFPKQSFVNVPKEYYELNDEINRQGLTGRIVYLPPANNNYFREYKWGFYGSQFLSYIIPNPLFDSALTVGSKEGEEANKEFEMAVRNGDKEKFDFLLNKYEVEYVLMDKSLEEKGFTFEIDPQKLESLTFDLKVKFAQGNVTLYKSNLSKNSSLSEVDASGNIGYAKNIPAFPSIYPLSTGEDKYIIAQGFLVREYKYEGKNGLYNLNIASGVTEELPTLFRQVNSELISTPSFPMFESTIQSQTLPYVSYGLKGNTFGYFSLDSNVFTHDQLKNGVSIDTKFKNNANVFGYKNGDLVDVYLTSRFLKTLGSDCSGKIGVKGTLRKEQAANGFELFANSGEPCSYLPLDFVSNKDILKVSFDWESSYSTPGFCVYSKELNGCLNEGKYLYKNENQTFGSFEMLIDKTVQSSDKLSLILYARGSENIKVAFRNVKVSRIPFSENLVAKTQNRGDVEEQLSLRTGQTYKIYVPIISGDTSYLYQGNFPLELETNGNLIFSTSHNANNLQIKVQKGTLNLSQTLFNSSKYLDYLVYWSGGNIQNIPLNLCIGDPTQVGCYLEDIMKTQDKYSSLKFMSLPQKNINLSGVVHGLSYSKESINSLTNILVSPLPRTWKEIKYTPGSKTSMNVVELNPVGNQFYSTNYKLLDKGNAEIISIPQSQDAGWLAIASTPQGFFALKDDSEVVINGWKQGWDISNIDASRFYVIYWPNLLAYWGYATIIVELIFILVLIKRDAKRKK